MNHTLTPEGALQLRRRKRVDHLTLVMEMAGLLGKRLEPVATVLRPVGRRDQGHCSAPCEQLPRLLETRRHEPGLVRHRQPLQGGADEKPLHLLGQRLRRLRLLPERPGEDALPHGLRHRGAARVDPCAAAGKAALHVRHHHAVRREHEADHVRRRALAPRQRAGAFRILDLPLRQLARSRLGSSSPGKTSSSKTSSSERSSSVIQPTDTRAAMIIASACSRVTPNSDSGPV